MVKKLGKVKPFEARGDFRRFGAYFGRTSKTVSGRNDSKYYTAVKTHAV
jgi:hypothetical protein